MILSVLTLGYGESRTIVMHAFARREKAEICCDEFAMDLIGDYDVVDEKQSKINIGNIPCLHTLSSEYKTFWLITISANCLLRRLLQSIASGNHNQMASEYQPSEDSGRISSNTKGEFIMDKFINALTGNLLPAMVQ